MTITWYFSISSIRSKYDVLLTSFVTCDVFHSNSQIGRFPLGIWDWDFQIRRFSFRISRYDIFHSIYETRMIFYHQNSSLILDTNIEMRCFSFQISDINFLVQIRKPSFLHSGFQILRFIFRLWDRRLWLKIRNTVFLISVSKKRLYHPQFYVKKVFLHRHRIEFIVWVSNVWRLIKGEIEKSPDGIQINAITT